jgi:predicted aspartyl protease
MSLSFRTLAGFLALPAVCLAPFAGIPAMAEAPCKMQLQRIAKLEMSTDASGSVLVPMKFGGKTVQMIVDTGGIFTSVSEETVGLLGLQSRKIVGTPYDRVGAMPQHYVTQMWGGSLVDRIVTINDIELGAIKADEREFYVIPAGQLPDGDGGLLAPDILRAFDLDFDFANATLSLFSQDHCNGHVVYWTEGPVARVPVTINKYGHMVVPVQLDGKTILAAVDMGADRTTMSWEGTRHLFNLSDDDPRLKKVSTAEHHYNFDSIALEGLTINHPDIQLISDDVSKMDHADFQMLLGRNALRQLHLYIAYKEGYLYVTPASAR